MTIVQLSLKGVFCLLRSYTLQSRSSFQVLLILSSLNEETIWIHPQEEALISHCVWTVEVLDPVLFEDPPALAACPPKSVGFQAPLYKLQNNE